MSLRAFNPLKKQEFNDIHYMLLNLLNNSGRHICFYNDNVGYYSSPLRGHDTSLWFHDPRYYNLYIMLQEDIFLTKTVFSEFVKGFHWDLIGHFEERVTTEKNPLICSFMLFCLHNLSDADDASFSLYNKGNVERLETAIQKLETFSILDKTLLLANENKDSFIVSIDKEFDNNEGLIITKSRFKKYELMKKVGLNNIYYVPKR